MPQQRAWSLRHAIVLGALAMVAAWSSAASVARADAPVRPGQPDAMAVAQARSLFEQGLAAADRQDWTTAVDLFTRSIAVRPSPSVEFNLGLALVQLGRRADARVHLVLARDRTSDPAVRERARAEVAGLERMLGRVDLRLATPLGAAELRIDGRALTAQVPRSPIFVDAGGHVFAIVRDGRDVDWAAAEVQPGGTVVVSLDPSRAAPPPRVDTDPAPGIRRDLSDPDDDDQTFVVRRRQRRARERSSSVLEQWWFWTAIGVVVAGAATATAVVVTSGGDDPYRGNLGAGTFEIP